MSDITRAMAASARSWVGTKFVHQGRLKKSATSAGGVDCLGLLIGVAEELQLQLADGTKVASLDERTYQRIPDGQLLKEKLSQLLTQISSDDVEEGDVVLVSFDGNPQHLGLIVHHQDDESDSSHLNIIHAYAQVRKVVEHHYDAFWRGKTVAAFRI